MLLSILYIVGITVEATTEHWRQDVKKWIFLV